MWAAIGSAVGLGSIWRFPYIAGQNGGAAFILLFVAFLILISLPVLIAEIVIGRKAALNPYGAFKELGKSQAWGGLGFLTIMTGFLVSSFYSVICGWTLGYLYEAILGGVTHFQSIEESTSHFQNLVSSPYWSLATHASFILLASWILYTGVRKGIERWNEIFMPLLFFILLLLAIRGFMMQGGGEALRFLFSPDFSTITPSIAIMALGQAFFGLSLGQGTMVTYGSYLSKKENIPRTCLPIAIAVVLVSLLAGVAIFSVVFTAHLQPTDGTNLMFSTLPLVFSELPGGYFLACLFFLLIFLAGLTSQISAMEPLISYFIDQKKWTRRKALFWCAAGVFVLGIPSSLSFGAWKSYTFFGVNFFEAISYFAINILIPIGGLAAVLLTGWRWGIKETLHSLSHGCEGLFQKYPLISYYLAFSIKILSPLVIFIIFLNILGVF